MAKDTFNIQELVDSVNDFIREIVIPYEKDPRNEDHGPNESLRSALIEEGRKANLIAPQLPGWLGGHNLNHKDMAKIFRASGYSTLGPIAMNIMAPDEGNMHLLEKVATPEQQEHFLVPLAAGETRSAFLMTEPDGGAGSDTSMMATMAIEDGDYWVINGRKTFITGGDGAAFGIIMAKTRESATMFLADMETPGIEIDRVLETIDSSMPGGHAIIDLKDVRVPSKNILGEINKGFRYAQVRLAPARLTHCMRWWGSAKRAHDIAEDYACNREAFSKPLIDHEGVGFMLADNLIDLKQSELIIDWCADILDSGATGTAESSMAKVAVSEALFRIADRCVQILGATGVSKDTVVEQVFREIRAFRIYDGPSEVHRWSLAKKIKREHG